jgi:hypothetical protein
VHAAGKARYLVVYDPTAKGRTTRAMLRGCCETGVGRSVNPENLDRTGAGDRTRTDDLRITSAPPEHSQERTSVEPRSGAQCSRIYMVRASIAVAWVDATSGPSCQYDAPRANNLSGMGPEKDPEWLALNPSANGVSGSGQTHASQDSTLREPGVRLALGESTFK